jgi:biopolymer transport protein ExbB/TolQ
MGSRKNIAAVVFAVAALLILGAVVWSMMSGKGGGVKDEDWQAELRGQLHETKFGKPEKEFSAEEHVKEVDAKLRKMVANGVITAEAAREKMDALMRENGANMQQGGWSK